MSVSTDDAYVIKRNRRRAAAPQFDAILFGAVLAVTAAGYYFLYVVRQTFNGVDDLTDAAMNRQLLAIVLGVAAALFLSSVDYRFYQLPSYVIYIASVFILLLTTLFGAGGVRTGNKNWITMLGVNFQPSEFAKITFIVVSSSFLERISEKRASKLDYAKMIFYAGLPIALVQLQKDTGTVLVFIVMLSVMLFIGGIKYRYIFAALGALTVSLPLLWTFVLRDVQKMRIMIFLNPELDKTNTGYQPTLARAAIGAGELFGRQTDAASQARYSIVPARHTDFIFTVIAEKTGFVGCALLIIMYLVIILRCFYIASRAHDKYGEYMAVGLAGMLMFHFVENVGMCIGILPITGIPLPFVSYGGTSMITNFIAIGIIQSVSVTRDPPDMNAPGGFRLLGGFKT